MLNSLFLNLKKNGLIIFALLALNGFVNASTKTLGIEVLLKLKTLNICDLSVQDANWMPVTLNTMVFKPWAYSHNTTTVINAVKLNHYPLKTFEDGAENGLWLAKLLSFNTRESEMITINPNPVKDDLNVKWNFVVDGEKTVSVLDLNGNTVLQFKNIEKNSLSKNLRLLQKGFYVLKLSNQSDNQVIAYRKFIKE